jgi:tRNA threonylcarbamoyladenosine biosynthesis protein TsaE
MKILVKNKRNLAAAARELLDTYPAARIFAFHGQPGAGKTTFIKAACKILGAVDTVTSPTFTIVNEYMTSSGELLYHVDFYRIARIEEAFDFGIEEYLHGRNYCFIEWPAIAQTILPPGTVMVYITTGNDDTRIIEVS